MARVTDYEHDLITLVPVLSRPDNVSPLVTSHALTTPGSLMFVVTESDQAELEAVDASGADYITTDLITWPDKINTAYQMIHRHNLADWVLFAADDITFHEGWWDETGPLRAQPEVMVIGTNDLGNPRVIAGEHTTHPLVRSSYLGTIDDPDSVVHTGYQHWFVDDEFVITAKQRGVWAFCPTAVVEHHHPYWDRTVEWDATYEKGQSNSTADRELFRQRAPLLGVELIE